MPNFKKNNSYEVMQDHFHGLKIDDLLSLDDLDKVQSILKGLEEFVKDISGDLTSSQLRNVYAKILETKSPLDLQLIRPNLAYVAARQEKDGAKKMMAFIDALIQKVTVLDQQKAFNKIMEAVVAYHKYHSLKK